MSSDSGNGDKGREERCCMLIQLNTITLSGPLPTLSYGFRSATTNFK